MSKYYFKHNEYELATKAFDYGVNLYCNDMGPFGGKTYQVYSFDPADVELDEDEEENGITAEDYDRPVVFSKPIGQGSGNSTEWYRVMGDLWCDNEDLETFKKDTDFYSEDVVEEILKKIKDNGINPEIIVTKLGGVMPKNESIENNTFNRYIVENGYLLTERMSEESLAREIRKLLRTKYEVSGYKLKTYFEDIMPIRLPQPGTMAYNYGSKFYAEELCKKYFNW